MGTTVTLSVRGPSGALDAGERVVRRCERRWSRFLPTSELSRLNAGAGHPTILERDTFELVAAAVDSWRLTGGRFDPTVEPALVAAGYDRSFEQASRTATAAEPAPGCAAIALDDDLGAVTLPADVRLDLGGIAKGHAADLAAEAMRAVGADGVVGIEDPFVPGVIVAVVRLGSGAVATSSVLRRRWRDGPRELHHVIDPRTGAPSRSDLAAVSVVAATTSWAEVLAKAALVAGSAEAPGVVAGGSATGMLFTLDGDVVALPGLEHFT